jgi:hypothetical protein
LTRKECQQQVKEGKELRAEIPLSLVKSLTEKRSFETSFSRNCIRHESQEMKRSNTKIRRQQQENEKILLKKKEQVVDSSSFLFLFLFPFKPNKTEGNLSFPGVSSSIFLLLLLSSL